MFKSAHRISVPASLVHPDCLFACATGCIALHTALTAVWHGLLGDMASMLFGFAVTVFLAHRLLSTASARAHSPDDLCTAAAALAWSVWGASRGAAATEWLPSLLLALLTAPRTLVLAALAIGIASIATPYWLAGSAAGSAQAVGLSLAVGLCAAFYRLALTRREVQGQTRARLLEAVIEAAEIDFIEIDHRGKLSVLSERLLCKLDASVIPHVRSGADATAVGHAISAWRMLDLFHPDDHLVAARAQQRAGAAAGPPVDAHASCDCRLLRSDGSSLWVHAHFLKPASQAGGTVVVFVAIEERKRMERELHESRRRLEAQGQELATQFEVSKNALHARQEVERLAQHDLKSPLKSIAAAASMLRGGRTLSESEEALLASIERTAGRALAIVSMSLDLYRMEEGTFRFVPEVVDLAEIGRRVVSDISLHARTKNVRLDFSGKPHKVNAIGNEVFVTSVVENLVRNAVEAAPDNSVVRLAIHEGARVGLMIHNEGAVPQEIRESFFEKCVTHGKRDGLGLGTYSARLIARAQGGDLTMSSSEQNGTTLTLELRRDSDSHERLSPPQPNTSRSMQTPTSATSSTSATSAGCAPAVQPELCPIDLLVVEDDNHNWLLLSSWLPAHIQARRAINGRDAVDALVRRRPDLVIMDLEMPVMTGFEALKHIREMQSLAGETASTIVAFTGYDDIETTERIASAGFDGILSKPVVKAEFDALIASMSREAMPLDARRVWVEKPFADAFPDFIESRRALIDDIERAAAAGDFTTARRAAHTLAGSPAIHEFESGIGICRDIIAATDDLDVSWLAEKVAVLRDMLTDPAIR